jgi:transcriptional regulator with XRE-family HTH domain
VFELTGDYRMARKARKDISKMIRKVRSALGLTQEHFAAKVGVTVSTVNRWENDKGDPSPLAMRQIEKLQRKINRSK